ncbi:MAG TPA: type VI secretion system lipoprotein TssJ, partial [Gammaproteobacteria bacterium]|nr:type VI secretion system lipoprotein TssJ [Gammaproteobacteria bacterium]
EVNPSISGRPSPVVVRLYELKSLAAFNAADFFTLYQNDSATLGGDLVKREEYVLRPGGQKIYSHEVPGETQYLAVIAAFRDIDQAVWKGSLPVPANRTTNITVHLNRVGLALEAQ